MDVKREPFDFDNHVEIKQEIIECKGSKIEQRSDLLIKIDNDYDCVQEYKYLQNVHNIDIKKEREVADLYVDINDVKQEACEIEQPKTENELFTLLTTQCDLPSLKDESTALPSYLDQPSSSNKQANRTFKSFKDTSTITCGFKKAKRKWKYPSPVDQKTFRSSKKKLFDSQFGRCHETCYYCGHFFLNKSQFLSHFFVYHNVKKVTNICKRKFAKYEHCTCKSCLPQLIPNITFPCDFCFKVFLTEKHLNNHSKSHYISHTREKPFKCDICTKQFKQKNNLIKHKRIHTGEKPFKCETCSKQFSLKHYLRSHLKIHTGEKPFICEMCSKRFKRKGDLKNHIKIHTGEKPFECEICSKQFTVKGDLTRHKRMHSREKPFKCEICSKQYVNKSYLKSHLRVHTGEKPFKCEICLKQFKQKHHLKKHIKMHTDRNRN